MTRQRYRTVEDRLAMHCAAVLRCAAELGHIAAGIMPTASEAEIVFIANMRAARVSGVGYGWMQQVIEWEWQAVTDGQGWGPELHGAWIAKAQARAARFEACWNAAKRRARRYRRARIQKQRIEAEPPGEGG